MNNKKQDEVSPEELWKKVSQQLSSKKYESASKVAYTTMFDISSLFSEIEKINKDMNKERSKMMIENSLLNIPYFKEIDPKYDFNNVINDSKMSDSCKITDSKINDSKITENKITENKTPNIINKIPKFFPKHPFIHFNNPNFYKKFDLDTLFFIFYYFKGNIQQTYAAIKLKNYAWRFHLKYKMWFQRLDEPKLITSEYEKGEFLFFDYETTWNFMKKNDFVFEYFYLEHNDYY